MGFFFKSKQQQQQHLRKVRRNAVMNRQIDNAMKQSAAQDRASRRAARARDRASRLAAKANKGKRK